MIEHSRWLKAQQAERRFHTQPFETGYEAYRQSYRQYFEHLGMSFDCQEKTILEIGPADYPALAYCTNYEHSYIIEPMPGSILQELIKGRPITHIAKPAEDICWQSDLPMVDEVWLFNVLQHVKDPAGIILNSMETAHKVRFFEPINCGTSDCHLWNFTLEYFRDQFGDLFVKHYRGNPGAVNFHTHECAYGTWDSDIWMEIFKEQWG